MATKNKIKISNDFVHSVITNNNALTLKILFYIISNGKIQNDNEYSSKAVLELGLLKKTLNIDFKTLRRNIQLIQKTLITIHTDKKEIIDSNIIHYAKYDYKNQSLVCLIYKDIISYLIDLKNKFTIIDLDNLFQLQGKHSIRLLLILENLNGYTYAKNITYNLYELNQLLGTNYKTITEIERAVLLPVQKELDQYSKLTFIYDLLYDLDCPKVGRKPLIGVKIYLKDNKTRQLKMF